MPTVRDCKVRFNVKPEEIGEIIRDHQKEDYYIQSIHIDGTIVTYHNDNTEQLWSNTFTLVFLKSVTIP